MLGPYDAQIQHTLFCEEMKTDECEKPWWIRWIFLEISSSSFVWSRAEWECQFDYRVTRSSRAPWGPDFSNTFWSSSETWWQMVRNNVKSLREIQLTVFNIQVNKRSNFTFCDVQQRTEQELRIQVIGCSTHMIQTEFVLLMTTIKWGQSGKQLVKSRHAIQNIEPDVTWSNISVSVCLLYSYIISNCAICKYLTIMWYLTSRWF